MISCYGDHEIYFFFIFQLTFARNFFLSWKIVRVYSLSLRWRRCCWGFSNEYSPHFLRRKKSIIIEVSETRVLYFQIQRDLSGRRKRRNLLLAYKPHRRKPNQNIEQFTCLGFHASCNISHSPKGRKKQILLKEKEAEKKWLKIVNEPHPQILPYHYYPCLTSLVIITYYLKSPFVIWKLNFAGAGYPSKFRMGGCREWVLQGKGKLTPFLGIISKT